jgi:hypothetical protein
MPTFYIDCSGPDECHARGPHQARLVVESSAFLFKDSILPPTYLLGRLLFPTVVADARAMEQVFRQRQLDWTVVRPRRLTDGKHTGTYRRKQSHLPHFGFSISRADAADYFLRLVEDPESVRKVIGVSQQFRKDACRY